MPKESNKPKVLFIATNIPTPKRNSNRVVMTIAHKLSERFDISVMHPREIAPFPFNLMKKYRNLAGNKSWEDQGIKVSPMSYLRLFGQKNAFLLLPLFKRRALRQALDAGTPQLLHAHYAIPDGFLAYQLHQSLHIPYMISFRGSDIKYLKLNPNCDSRKKLQAVLSHAATIIVHNGSQKEILAEHGFNSILIAHGLETEFFPDKEPVKSSDNITIATVGELIAQKRIDWIIKAFKNYQGDKDIRLRIAGEGPLRPQLEALAAEDQRIQFLGKISHDEVGRLLNETHIFALPSHNETFGLVYLEAAAHQNAVIATRGTGIWGVFNDEEEMLYCDSFESFERMLFDLIDKDEMRIQMANKAFARTRKQYTWDQVTQRYFSVYDDLLNEKNPTSCQSNH